MAHLIVFVLNDLEKCSMLLDAWEAAGAPGVTIIESTGLQRLRGALRDDLPLFPSLRDLLQGSELHHRTLFTVVASEEAVDRIVAATEEVVGDLEQPHTGLFFVVPVSRALGLNKQNG